MNMSPILRLDAVSKSYGKTKAIDNVSFLMRPSEFIGLLGQNGAGKSTLFQLLTGLFTADSGQVEVCGIDIRKSPIAALSSIGVVFQQSTLDMDLTVEGNLLFHCRLHGISKTEAKKRISDELQRFGLSEVRITSVKKLSGGNRRKVELIRALLHRPRILLMDEATVGLDPESRMSLLDYVNSLCRERGLSVLWSTHIVEEVASADRVIVLNKGSVVIESEPSQLITSAIKQKSTLEKAFMQLINDDNKSDQI